MAERRAACIEGVDDRLTVIAPDRPGLFSRVAGVLALNGLDVLAAAAYSERRRHGARGRSGSRAATGRRSPGTG